MNTGVIYLLTGVSHAARLVVSLWSLRRHYQGPVTLYTTRPESHDIGERCAADARLGVTHQRAREHRSRKNSSFLTKLALLEHCPCEVTAYFDCDTLIAGDISPLFASAAEHEFCATQFAEWQSTTRVVRKRIEAWKCVKQSRYEPEWLSALVDGALLPQPAVNGGVFAFRRGAALLRPWFELAAAGWRTFICDEIALQMLLRRYPHAVLDCRFNCSPIHALPREDVRVWHFHGEKHLRKAVARKIWWPEYLECVREDVAGLRGWTPGGDPQLQAVLEGAECK